MTKPRPSLLLIGTDGERVLDAACRHHGRLEGTLRLLVALEVIDAPGRRALFDHFFDTGVEVVAGDKSDRDRLEKAMRGVERVIDLDRAAVPDLTVASPHRDRGGVLAGALLEPGICSPSR